MKGKKDELGLECNFVPINAVSRETNQIRRLLSIYLQILLVSDWVDWNLAGPNHCQIQTKRKLNKILQYTEQRIEEGVLMH